MAFSCVQSKSGTAASGVLTVTFTSTTTSGNLICAGSAHFGNGTHSLADAGTNSWNIRQSSTLGSVRTQITDAVNITGKASHAVLLTATNAGDRCMGISEYSGAHTLPSDVGTVGLANSTTAAASGNTASTAEATELVFGYTYAPSTNTNYTCVGGTATSGAVGSSMVKRQEVDSGGGETLAIGDKTSGAVGATSVAFTSSATTDHVVGCWTYKNAAAGSTTPPFNPRTYLQAVNRASTY